MTSNASGVAAVPTFTANDVPGTYAVTASADDGAYSTTFSLTNNPDTPANRNATDGDEQTTAIGTAYGGRLQLYVTDLFGNPVNGVQVTFTAPVGGALGTFAGGETSVTKRRSTAMRRRRRSPPTSCRGRFTSRPASPG